MLLDGIRNKLKLHLVTFYLRLITVVICKQAVNQGIPYLIEGIVERGLAGVNYGRVLFPLLFSGLCFWQFKKKE